MNTKIITIAALLAATLLTGFLSTPMAAYAGGDHDDNGRDHDDNNGGDISKTNTEQKLRQNNIGDSDSTNFNCGQNLINSPNVDQTCEALDEEGTDGGDPTVECEACLAAFVEAVGTTNPLITAALSVFSCDGFTAEEADALIVSLEAIPLIDASAVADLEACLDAVLAAV
jgi:hypothetical protein